MGNNQESLSERVIRELYKITSSYNSGFEYQVKALLKMGLERFNLDIGILSKINGDVYKVMSCVVPGDIAMQPSDEFSFAETYCSLTCHADKPLAVEHAQKNDALAVHPAYRKFSLESYIGVPIKINGELYGTLNFSSHKPYPRKFLEIDIDALQLMNSWVEVELIRRIQEQQLNELNAELTKQANYDSLTQLPNRRSMFNKLNVEFNRLIRNKGQALIALIDIDHFKKINDNYGHSTGDEVLVKVSDILSNTIRNYDFIARLGGEEFLLWCPDCNEEVGLSVCERVLKNLEKSPGNPCKITASIGVYHIKFDNISDENNVTNIINNTLKKTDTALYDAKEKGRNRIEVFNDNKKDFSIVT